MCRFTAVLPGIEEIQSRVNKRYDDLFKMDNDKASPYVCGICDEFILHQDDMAVLSEKKMESVKDLFSWSTLLDTERIPAVEEHHKFKGSMAGIVNKDLFKNLAISPRACIYRKGPRCKPGLLVCKECEAKCTAKKLPFYAIINKNYLGVAPKCLTDLNETELAFLTPVRTHGYCFHYAGGAQMQLKGTLAFMRVKERRITKAVAALQMLGLADTVVVICSGKMTKEQRKRARSKSECRTDYLIAAAKWLCANHKSWRFIEWSDIEKEIRGKKVVCVDNSVEVDSSNAYIEREELFTCYYPDGTTNETDGGFNETGAFKQFASDLQKMNFEVELKANLQKEFVKDSNADQLIGSCLLQFPYGVGGLDERRKTPKGDFTESPNIDDFFKHLSRRSDPSVQLPLIQLIMHSMISRSRLLRMSRLQVKNDKDASELANGINYDDVRQCILARRNGDRFSGTNVSKKLLQSVEAGSRALPHANEATRKARTTGESMQHHFGTGSIFATVTFDDENNFLMQVLTGEDIDDGTDISSLSDEELERRGKKRKEIRIEYPGAAAMHFEMLIHTMVEEVVGWDMRNNCATDAAGFFGKCKAFCMAIEEQGRKTLHGHMTIWIEGYREVAQDMFFASGRKKVDAENALKDYVDRIASTELFAGASDHEMKKVTDHDCQCAGLRDRSPPEVTSEQGLRNPRHKNGFKHEVGKFAYCKDCEKEWTHETLMSDLLVKGHNYVDPSGDYAEGHIPKSRLHAEIIQYQRSRNGDKPLPKLAISAAYQHHLSCHCRGCFRCAKSRKRGHACGPLCECRYRLPDVKRRKTRIQTDYEGVPWFHWNGEKQEQPLVQIQPRRSKYDLFQNVSCRGISESKFACNSNVSAITDGPVAQYVFKYEFKNTQGEDTAEYGEVEYNIKKNSGRVHSNDRSEALRLMCRATFAHNKTNVISPPFASYLVRNESRFYFSHQFAYCPIKDVAKLHDSKKVSSILKYDRKGSAYFENQALHYLCRPKCFEDLSLKEFAERLEVKYATKKNTDSSQTDNPVNRFLVESGPFKHPSRKETKKGSGVYECRQGVRYREHAQLAKIVQWQWPDSANFGANLLTCAPSEFKLSMEECAQLVLVLLFPHREAGDLKVSNGGRFEYLLRLRQVYEDDECTRVTGGEPILFTSDNKRYLQNIQTCTHNCLRYKVSSDQLQKGTEAFSLRSDEPHPFDAFDEADEDEQQAYEDFMERLQLQENTYDAKDSDRSYLLPTLQGFTLKKLRNKGFDECGYQSEKSLKPIPEEDDDTPFVECPITYVSPTGDNNTKPLKERRQYSMRAIVKILLRRSTVTRRTNVFDDTVMDVSDANGSPESIIEWAKFAFDEDPQQRRAFESISSAFILTFFETENDEEAGDIAGTRDVGIFRRHKNGLFKLKGSDGLFKKAQLIALLHGPGGSGKSTVINMVLAYAKSFCEGLGHPFTNRTIIVTAMSGVAATLIHGETTHSVLGLNKNNLAPDAWEDFADSRLLFIDEISFAGREDFAKLHENCCILMRNHYQAFGGLNVVFAGDYSQLEPVKKTPVHIEEAPEFQAQLNCYMELSGQWRFKDDPTYGKRMARFREGEPEIEDIETLNRECSINNKPAPVGIQVATYRNRNRDAINSKIFDDYCEKNSPSDGTVLQSAAVIFMSDIGMRDSTNTIRALTSNATLKYFYEHVGEDDCDVSGEMRGRIDPVLKLYRGCPMMNTLNSDVLSGQANGSRVHVLKVVMKVGEQPFPLELENGAVVNAMFAHQVKCILVKHEAPDVHPSTFEVKPQSTNFKCKLRFDTGDMKAACQGTQFPIISNSATTGHKLQGCSCKELLVNDWNYGSNWAYVVLSRVRTMAGLYLRAPLSLDLEKHNMPTAMKDMLADFKQRVSLTTLTPEDYQDMTRRQPAVVTP